MKQTDFEQLSYLVAERTDRPFIANQYAFEEVAEGVCADAKQIIQQRAPDTLRVEKLEWGGGTVVVVMGTVYDRQLRRQLARLFTIGWPFEPPEELIRKLNGADSVTLA